MNILLRNAGAVSRLGKTKIDGYTLFLALIPVVMFYKTPFMGVGLSTVLVAATMPYAGMKAIYRSGRGTFEMVLPMALYCGYVILQSDSDPKNILLTLAAVVHLLAAASGAVRLPYARKVIETISVLAAAGVIIQTVVYYLFHFHLPMIADSWGLDAISDSNRKTIATGISKYSALYRPSAFFLEPSHLAQYAIVGLISCLFRPITKYRTAAVISLGILLSTSGMGMVLTVFTWGTYTLRLLRESNMKKGLSRFLSVVTVALIAVSVLSQLSVMQSAFARFSGVFLDSTSEYDAISGRTLYWKKYIAPMTGSTLIWGMGFSALPEVYFTGFMEILFCYGWVGIGLFYWTVIGIIIKTSGFGRCVAISVGGLLLIANLSGFLSFIYFFGVLYASWRQQRRLVPANRRIVGRGQRIIQYRGRRRNGL